MQMLNAGQKTKRIPAGRIPVDWEAINLGDYLKEISVRNAPVNPDLPVLSVTNTQGFVTSESYFDRKVYSKDLSNYKIVSKEQFSYNPSRINVGSIAQLKNFDQGCLSPMYVVFEAQKGLDADYLAYWIQSGRFKNLINANTQGTVRDSVNFSALAGFPFALPPVNEQKKITRILSCIDDVINKTQSVIEQTQRLKKALMQELFTRGLPGRHKKFKKTKIGEIPEGWEVKSFRECVSISEGQRDPKQEPYRNWILIAPDHIESSSGRLIEKRRALDQNAISGKYEFSPGDVIYSKIRPYLRKAVLADFKGLCSADMYPLRPKEFVTSEFLLWVMLGDRFSKYAESVSSRTGIPKINRKELADFQIAVPSINEQNKITEAINSLVRWADIEMLCFGQIKFLKSALMQVLLTGEARVK